jgi:hypothetical protein
MPNHYYLVDLGTNPNTKNQRVNFLRGLLPTGPTRTAARDQLHWSESVNKRYYLAQAESSEDEHAQMMGQAWITTFPDSDAVLAYMMANPVLWYPPDSQPVTPP